MVKSIKKPVVAARLKSEEVRKDVLRAEKDLHDANTTLQELAADSAAVTLENVEATVAQSVEVEAQLHNAVNKLELVTDLLKTAEIQIAAENKDAAEIGKTGEGLSSVLAQMNSPSRKPI